MNTCLACFLIEKLVRGQNYLQLYKNALIMKIIISILTIKADNNFKYMYKNLDKK